MTQMRDTERLLRERILDLQEQLEAAQSAMRRARYELDQWVFADGSASYRVERAEAILDAVLNPAPKPYEVVDVSDAGIDNEYPTEDDIVVPRPIPRIIEGVRDTRHR